ncbi:MAG TPA: hypothetical protein VLT91_09295 [Rhizomicrobium sp.]|nr:hypothetical protein [Rhizomicrobium sp.]
MRQSGRVIGFAAALALLPGAALSQTAPPPSPPPPTTTTATPDGTDNGQQGVPTVPQYPQNPSHKPPCQLGDMICAYGGQPGNDDPNNSHS